MKTFEEIADTAGKGADVKKFSIEFCKYVVFFFRKGSFLANYENIHLVHAMLQIFFSCLTEFKLK